MLSAGSDPTRLAASELHEISLEPPLRVAFGRLRPSLQHHPLQQQCPDHDRQTALQHHERYLRIQGFLWQAHEHPGVQNQGDCRSITVQDFFALTNRSTYFPRISVSRFTASPFFRSCKAV